MGPRYAAEITSQTNFTQDIYARGAKGLPRAGTRERKKRETETESKDRERASVAGKF